MQVVAELRRYELSTTSAAFAQLRGKAFPDSPGMAEFEVAPATCVNLTASRMASAMLLGPDDDDDDDNESHSPQPHRTRQYG